MHPALHILVSYAARTLQNIVVSVMDPSKMHYFWRIQKTQPMAFLKCPSNKLEMAPATKAISISLFNNITLKASRITSFNKNLHSPEVLV